MIDVGQTIGDYRAIARLGEGHGCRFSRGASGHRPQGRAQGHSTAARPESRCRRLFVNEATAINRIGHEHIVEVTDFEQRWRLRPPFEK
jgi:hypothetical protein